MTSPVRALILALAWTLPAASPGQGGSSSAHRQPTEADARTPHSAPTVPTPEPPRVRVGTERVTSAANARRWRQPPAIETEDIVLAVPRVLLRVPSAVLSAAFWPVRRTLSLVDEYAVVENVRDLLFNDERTAAVLPLVTYESGFGLTYGANALHDSLFGYDEQLRLSAKAGGRYRQSYQALFRGDRVKGSRLWLEVRARYDSEPALLFRGIGMQDDLPPAAHYLQERFLGVLRFGHTSGSQGSKIKTGVTAVVNHRSFGRHRSGDPQKRSLQELYDTSAIPFYDSGALILELGLNLVVDYRDGRGFAAAGPYLELFAGGAPGFDDTRYWHYGGELAYALPIYRRRRRLVLRAAFDAVQGKAKHIPFTELPGLGGPNRMRGYPLRTFRDKKAALASVEYHYPIHQYVSGVLFVDTGTVSPGARRLADLERWRQGYGGGLLFGNNQKIFYRLDLSYGDGFFFFFSSDLAQALEGRTKQL